MAMVKKTGILALALVAALTAGCGGKEEREAKYLERGKQYLAEENYDKAKIEFKNVLQIDPKSSRGTFYLAQIAEKTGGLQKAFGGYRKAVELDPDNIEARAKLGQFDLLWARSVKASNGDSETYDKAMADAREQAAAILKKDPKHEGGRLLQAGIDQAEGDVDKAIAEAKAVLADNPGSDVGAIMLSNLYLLKEDNAAAEQALKSALKANPESERLMFQLAQLYAKQKRSQDAAAVMEDLIRLKPEELDYRVSLASYYAQLNQPDKAEQTLRDAIAVDEEDAKRYLLLGDFLAQRRSPEAAEKELKAAIDKLPEESDLYLGLAKIYLQAEQKDKAVAMLNTVVDRWSKDAPGYKARNILAQIHLQEGDEARARSELEAILADNPQNNDALLLRGKLNLKDGKLDEAVADFRSLIKDQPNNAEVLGLLAEAHLKKGELELARDNLQRAVEAQPQNIEARLRYGRFLIGQKEFDLAAKQIDAVLAQKPDNVPALIAKTDILAMTKQIDELQTVVDKLKQVAPDNPEGYFRSGRMLKAQGKNEEALAEYEKALLLAQEAGRAVMLAEIVDLQIQMGQLDAAEQRVRTELAGNPEHPVANGLLGKVLSAKKEFAAAEKAYLKQIELGAGETMYAGLAYVRSAQGDLAGAEQAFNDGLAKYPQSVRLLIGLAGVKEKQGDFDGAIAAYDKVLEIQPENAVATNNLAALIADHRSSEADLARAKVLADKLDALPQAVFQDTVGWVYYRVGELDKAVKKLELAVKASPEAAVFNYHLGMALAKAGDKTAAKTYLNKALSAEGGFDGEDEARKMLNSLN